MKARIIVKLALGLLVVGCIAAVAAAMPRRKSAGVEVEVEKSYAVKAAPLGEAARATPAPGGPRPKVLSLIRLKGLVVEPRRGGAAVRVEADFIETRPGIKYQWELDVYHERTNTRLIHRNYADKVFDGDSIEGGGIAFEDAFRLKPGTYRVKVSLYSLPNHPEEVQADGCELRAIQKFTLGR